MDDHFNSSRLNEEEMFDLVRTPTEDGSQFLNESGPGMEEERRDEVQTSIECDEDSQFGGHPQSGEVYEASDDQMQ
jgi:hypothetical protein